MTGLTNLYFYATRGLTSTLPLSFASLTALASLCLSSNSLSGQPMSVISALTRLTYLGLGDNQFTGTFPDLSSSFRTFWGLL